jgi:TolB-like protein/DNA-binding SARP family transcriptional activator
LSREKRLALLAYLALTARDGFQRKDKLVALFWPDSNQTRARQALRQALYVLRCELGENAILARGDEAVALNCDVVATDVGAFGAALEEGNHEAATKLYQGDLLDGFHLSGAPDFEQWLEVERAQLKKSCATAFERLAVSAELAEEWQVAARRRRDQVSFDPFDSRVALLAAHAADNAGNAADASRIIREHEARLRSELELPLPPELADFRATLSRRMTTTSDRAPRGEPDGPMPVESVGEGSREFFATSLDASTEQAIAPEVSGTRRARRWWIVLAATSVALAAGAAWWTATHTFGTRSHRLAVLPYVNLSNDPEQEYFVQGLHDALISELAQWGLGVIPRTSVMQYRNTDKPVRVIASELGADALIEASLIRTADSITIHTRLVDASTEQFLWAHSYAVDLRSVATLNRDMARAIARIQPGLTLDNETRAADARPLNLEAYDAYLRGQFYLRSLSLADVDNALRYF